jgi:hypothetical protein
VARDGGEGRKAQPARRSGTDRRPHPGVACSLRLTDCHAEVRKTRGDQEAHRKVVSNTAAFRSL